MKYKIIEYHHQLTRIEFHQEKIGNDLEEKWSDHLLLSPSLSSFSLFFSFSSLFTRQINNTIFNMLFIQHIFTTRKMFFNQSYFFFENDRQCLSATFSILLFPKWQVFFMWYSFRQFPTNRKRDPNPLVFFNGFLCFDFKKERV